MSTVEQDREANLFAMCLLMPERLVLEWIRKHYPEGVSLVDDDFLKAFCKAFQVPMLAASVRLADLGMFAGATHRKRPL